MCWAYAVAGALALNVLADRPDAYTYTAGTLMVRTGVEDGILAFDAEDPVTHGREFHAWVATRPAGVVGEGPAALMAGLEVIDLSARHYATRGAALGMPFHRPDIDRYVWSQFGDLPSLETPQGLFFRSTEAATLGVQRMWQQHQGALVAIAREAVTRLQM